VPAPSAQALFTQNFFSTWSNSQNIGIHGCMTQMLCIPNYVMQPVYIHCLQCIVIAMATKGNCFLSYNVRDAW